jgi:hypothetical protein
MNEPRKPRQINFDSTPQPKKEHPSAQTGPIAEEIPQFGNLNLITDTEILKDGKTLFVVMDKHRTTVLKQPGLEVPFQTLRRKYADQVAKESGGVVEPLSKAIKLVASSPCNLPKTSKWYNPDPRADKIPL